MSLREDFLNRLKETKYQVLTKNLSLIEYDTFQECLVVPDFLCILEIIYKSHSSSIHNNYYVNYKVNMFDKDRKPKIIEHKSIKCVKINYRYCEATTYNDSYGYYAELIDTYGNNMGYRLAAHYDYDLSELYNFMEALASEQKIEIDWDNSTNSEKREPENGIEEQIEKEKPLETLLKNVNQIINSNSLNLSKQMHDISVGLKENNEMLHKQNLLLNEQLNFLRNSIQRYERQNEGIGQNSNAIFGFEIKKSLGFLIATVSRQLAKPKDFLRTRINRS